MPRKYTGGGFCWPHNWPAVREAHAWYMADPDRTIAQAARRYEGRAATLSKAWDQIGLRTKTARVVIRDPEVPRPPTTYQQVVAAFRDGEDVTAIGDRMRLATLTVASILVDAGEACAECEILFSKIDEGIATVGGRRVCQDCVEVWGLEPDSWIREPEALVDLVEEMTGYAESVRMFA